MGRTTEKDTIMFSFGAAKPPVPELKPLEWLSAYRPKDDTTIPQLLVTGRHFFFAQFSHVTVFPCAAGEGEPAAALPKPTLGLREEELGGRCT